MGIDSNRAACSIPTGWTRIRATLPRWLPCCMMLSMLALPGCKPGTGKADETFEPGELTLHIQAPLESILIGDPCEVTLSAICPTNGRVDFPEVGREKDIVVLERSWHEEPLGEGHKKTELAMTITSFRPGDHVLCPEPVLYHHDGITETNLFPGSMLSVTSSLPADASKEIADIKPVRPLPSRIPRWTWIVLGSAVLAYLVGLVTSKLWHHRDALPFRAPPVPPHVIALNALRALKEKGLLERDACNPFYTELSLILRTYLEGRFHLNAPDETTEEIVEEMSRSLELSGAQRNILQEFMRQADMVKFAKGHPDRMTMEAAFETTQHFVEETKPSEGSDEP